MRIALPHRLASSSWSCCMSIFTIQTPNAGISFCARRSFTVSRLASAGVRYPTDLILMLHVCCFFFFCSDANLQVFHKCNGLQVLYTTAVQSSEGKSKKKTESSVYRAFVLSGARKSSRSIASLSCLVLRRCIPSLPLPLDTLENPISFPLPFVKDSSREDDAISRSSSKTTTSEFSTPVTSSDKVEETVENGAEEGSSTSMKRTNLPSSLHNSRQHSDSELSGSCSCEPQDSCQCSQNGHPSCKSLFNSTRTQGRSSRDHDDCCDSFEPSHFTRSTKPKISIDLALLSVYFPEITQETKERDNSSPITFTAPPASQQESLHRNHSSKSLSDPPAESAPKTPTTSPPVVVIPTGLQATDSSAETSNQSKTSQVARRESSETILNAVANFVEAPAPQVLGHSSPERSEPLYTKALSVDRYNITLHTHTHCF